MHHTAAIASSEETTTENEIIADPIGDLYGDTPFGADVSFSPHSIPDGAATPEAAGQAPTETPAPETPAPQDAPQPDTPALTAEQIAALQATAERAKSGQAAADRQLAETKRELAKAQALLEARNAGLDALRETAISQRYVDPDTIAAEVQKMDAYGQHLLSTAEQAEQTRLEQIANQERAAQDNDARARLQLATEAIPVITHAAKHGLADLDITGMMERHIRTDTDLVRDTQLSHQQITPELRAQLVSNIYEVARARTLAEVDRMAQSRPQTQERSQYDRTTVHGGSAGGREVLPEFTSVTDDLDSAYSDKPWG